MPARELPGWFHRGYLAMPERLRAVYTLSAGKGVDHAEIGRRLGLSVEEVEQHLADALVHLVRASADGG